LRNCRVNLLIDFDGPAKSQTSFTVDAASVDVGSPAFNDFVKSLALLDVGRIPTMSFASTQVEKIELGPSEGLPRQNQLGPLHMLASVWSRQANAWTMAAKKCNAISKDRRIASVTWAVCAMR